MRRVFFITLVLLGGIALGLAVAGVPRRSQDRPLSARPAVTTTTDPAKGVPSVETTPADAGSTTTLTR